RSRSRFLIEHDLFGKPVSTFPDHALDRAADRRVRPQYNLVREPTGRDTANNRQPRGRTLTALCGINRASVHRAIIEPGQWLVRRNLLRQGTSRSLSKIDSFDFKD